MRLKFNLLPKQKLYVNSTKDTAIYSGGVGAGKTISDVCVALKLCVENPGIDGLICAPTYGMLRDTIMREFGNHCPRALIKKQIYGPYPEVVFFTERDGKNSTLRFRAFDDAGKPKGLTLGFLIADEVTEMREDVFDELANRVRQTGMPNYKRYSTNPDNKEHFLYEKFIAPWEENINRAYVDYISTTSFDNYTLPKNYLDNLRRLEINTPKHYMRAVLGMWGDFSTDTIGAFTTIQNFSAKYLVAFIDTSFSDSRASDRTAVSIVGFCPDEANPSNLWRIEFTGASFQKSITDGEVIENILRFIDRFKPIEVCMESQLGDSTKIFIDRFRQGEKDYALQKNHWTVKHQSKNKHERIMLHVGGNKDRLNTLADTQKDFLNPIVSYSKGAKHEDEIDSLAGAVELWQTSANLKNFIYATEKLRRSGVV